MLVQLYNRQGQNRKFEAIFASIDKKQPDALGYMKDMSIPFGCLTMEKRIGTLVEKLDPGRYPRIAVVDPEGKVIIDSKAEKVVPALYKLRDLLKR